MFGLNKRFTNQREWVGGRSPSKVRFLTRLLVIENRVGGWGGADGAPAMQQCSVSKSPSALLAIEKQTCMGWGGASTPQQCFVFDRIHAAI